VKSITVSQAIVLCQDITLTMLRIGNQGIVVRFPVRNERFSSCPKRPTEPVKMLFERNGKGKGKGTVDPRTGHEGPEGD
jgi:hypothetical protein